MILYDVMWWFMMSWKHPTELLLKPHTSDSGLPKACEQPTWSPDIRQDCVKTASLTTTVNATHFCSKPLSSTKIPNYYALPGFNPTSHAYDPAWRNARSCLNNPAKALTSTMTSSSCCKCTGYNNVLREHAVAVHDYFSNTSRTRRLMCDTLQYLTCIAL